jgi:hypothetical protein
MKALSLNNRKIEFLLYRSIWLLVFAIDDEPLAVKKISAYIQQQTIY